MSAVEAAAHHLLYSAASALLGAPGEICWQLLWECLSTQTTVERDGAVTER